MMASQIDSEQYFQEFKYMVTMYTRWVRNKFFKFLKIDPNKFYLATYFEVRTHSTLVLY